MLESAPIIASLDAGSKNRLRQYQHNLARDYDRRNYDKVQEELLSKYVLRKGHFSETVNYLRNLKSSKDGKAFSQGYKDHVKLEEAIRAFGRPNYTWFGWNENYRCMKKKMIDEFSLVNASPLHYHSDDDIKNALPRTDTHAGFEYMYSGKKKKGDNLEGILKRYHKVLYAAVKYGKFVEPILVAERTQGKGHAFDKEGNQTGDCDHKTRGVSMISLLVIVAEMVFSKAIQEYMAKVNWYAGGKDLGGTLHTIINQYRAHYNYWISIDYSSYDSSISAWLIHDAFEIIHAAFPNLDVDDEALFSVVERTFIEKEFILSNEIVKSVKGVPSGSMFTQIIDSIVNRLIVGTYALAKGLDVEMIIMGDDNLIFSMIEVDPYDIASYIKKNFGIDVNAEKMAFGSCAQDDPEFLSCIWMYRGRYREPHEIIAKMLYPERQRNYKGKNSAKPEEVLFSYYLAYPLGMMNLINVEAFLIDYPHLRHATLESVGSQNLPGFIKYLKRYGGGHWAKANS